MTITTQKELRKEFWRIHQEFKGEKHTYFNVHHVQVKKTQNDYRTDVRVAWVDFVDHMEKSDQISEALAQRATL